jgi:hypothetical protein
MQLLSIKGLHLPKDHRINQALNRQFLHFRNNF